MSDLARRFSALLAETRVYAVTDDGLPPQTTRAIVEALLAAGVRLFQYRDKRSSDQERFEAVGSLAELVHRQGGLLIVNDRVDLAIAAGADGAHLGQDDLPLEIGRALLGPDRILGASASYLHELAPAVAAGIDYLGFGAVYSTDTKPDAELAGLDLLGQACAQVPVPVVGIGGITLERAPEVVARGAAGVAVVSALFRAADPEKAARELLIALRSN